MASNVPATICGAFNVSGLFITPGVGIGTNLITLDTTNGDQMWFVVIDLTSLAVVTQELGPADTAPPDIMKLMGNPQYFLIVLSVYTYMGYVPSGSLYTLLTSAGADVELTRLQQISEQTNSSFVEQFCYVFAGTMNGQGSTFEALSFTYPPLITFQFVPVEVDGSIIYSPTPL